MGRFINGQHHSWTSELGPNERFGAEDDMSFQTLALKLQANKQDAKTEFVEENLVEEDLESPVQEDISESNPLLDNLLLELKTYHESRENAVALIKSICEEYTDFNYTDNKELAELLSQSVAAQKLLDYYTNKFKS